MTTKERMTLATRIAKLNKQASKLKGTKQKNLNAKIEHIVSLSKRREKFLATHMQDNKGAQRL